MLVNIQYNLFRKRDGSWAVRIESGRGSLITAGFSKPETALLVAASICRNEGDFDEQAE